MGCGKGSVFLHFCWILPKHLGKTLLAWGGHNVPLLPTREKMGSGILHAWEAHGCGEVSEEGLAAGHNAGEVIIHKRNWR